MRIGIVYDRFGDTPAPAGAPPDWDAEFEPEGTIAAIEQALEDIGHEPARIGNARALLAAIAARTLDIAAAINIAEGYGTRNREAQAPVLLDMAGVPYIGSDALTLSVSLDKHMTKAVLESVVDTPAWHISRHGRPPSDPPDFPVIVKPRYEGTAKGIAASSRCEDAHALNSELARQYELYRQDLLVEAFVEGAEYTVGVVGEPPTALPVLQRATERATGIGLHALGEADDDGRPLDHDVSGILTLELERALQAAAIRAHVALECRDFSRSDFRVDGAGRVWFLEINPLPTFAPDGTFAILAELAGRPYRQFLGDILGAALDRVLTTPR